MRYLAVSAAGDSSAVSPIVLVHAFGSSRRAWAPQVEGLSDRHRVIADDLPGHGRTEGPFTLDGAVESVRHAIDETGGRAHVVGISGGAVVALLLCLEHPAQVTSLVISAGVACPPRWFALQRALSRVTPEPLLTRMLVGTYSGGRLSTSRSPRRISAAAASRPISQDCGRSAASISVRGWVRLRCRRSCSAAPRTAPTSRSRASSRRESPARSCGSFPTPPTSGTSSNRRRSTGQWPSSSIGQKPPQSEAEQAGASAGAAPGLMKSRTPDRAAAGCGHRRGTARRLRAASSGVQSDRRSARLGRARCDTRRRDPRDRLPRRTRGRLRARLAFRAAPARHRRTGRRSLANPSCRPPSLPALRRRRWRWSG